MLSQLIYVIIGIYASVQDIKYRKVSDIVHILIIVLSIPYLSFEGILGCVIGFTIFMLPNFFKDECIGGADIKFMATTGLLIGTEKIILATTISMVIAIVSTIILTKILKRKYKSIPLIPSLFIGCMFTFFV
ncbi:A24 family peptidase [Terrisporobacter petrolearius]|uniref:A24 family peptidase n=1 Tax=Terrisporobacter petrolearius TaxID=1460447 RepID=UPI0031CCBD3D